MTTGDRAQSSRPSNTSSGHHGPSQGGPGSSGRAHIVRQGECIATIAAKYGFAWQTIWDDVANEELRKKRDNPNVLAAGDIVQIPEKTLREERIQTDRVHKVRVENRCAKLRLRLTGHLEPLPDEEYLLEVGQQVLSGKTGNDGLIEATIKVSDRTATLTLPARVQHYTLEIGYLDPIDTVSGVQGRLRNIGLYEAPIDGQETRTLSAALQVLQTEEGLDVTGTMDAATVDKLRELHGS